MINTIMNLNDQKLLLDTLIYALSLKDPYTSNHSLDVSTIAEYIATKLNLNNDTIDCIIMAAKVHDIGKIGIPLEILVKPGKLTPEEYALIKTHPIIGYNILSKINWDYPIPTIVCQHHERLDSSGYPYGLNNNQILLESKIVAVADMVHALISHRPYRPSQGKDFTIKLLNEYKGFWLYDDAVDAAIEYISNLQI